MNSAKRRTYPLTDAQRGVVMAIIAEPASTAYNLPCAISLPAYVDIPRLQHALRTIVAARPTLRTRFIEDVATGSVRQYAASDLEVAIPVLQMSDDEVRDYAEHRFARPFKLFGQENLFRIEILQTPTQAHLLIDISHAVVDGLTLARWLLQRDLPDAYAGRELCEERRSIFEIAEAENAAYGDERYEASHRWFSERFADVEFARISTEKPSEGGQLLTTEVKMPRKGAERWCRRNGIRPELLFLGAFGLTLAKLSGTLKPAFCILHHGRTEPGALRAYGMFVRSMPMLINADGDLTTRQYFDLLRENEAETLRHAAYPVSHLYREIGTTPAATFGFQTSSIREMLRLDDRLLPGRQLPRSGVRGDLSCTVYVAEKDFALRVETSSEQHSATILRRIARALKFCAEQLMCDASQPIGKIRLVKENEFYRLRDLGDGKRVYLNTFSDLRVRMELYSTKRPNDVAILDENGETTYGELGRLIAQRKEEFSKMGVKEGDLVGISTSRNRDFIVEIFALWALGAAFSPAREGTKRKKPKILRHNLPTEGAGTAYVIYTSGSTGTPKGVIVPHEAIANLASFVHETWRITPQSRIACHSSFAFDASLEDIFGALHAGATLCIIPESLRRDPEAVSRYLAENNITGGCFTTSFGLQLRTEDIPLDYICLGGELLTQIPRAHAHTRILNTYGPTEFCVNATWHKVSKRRLYDEIPIGRPVWNTQASVVDPHGQLLPRGFQGELWLEGVQAATGYLDDAELTAKKFVERDRFSHPAYCTGDIVRWNEHGELIFVGRRDRQVKLRGYRIEPAEIESAMRSIKGVQEAAADVRRVGEHMEICAFYTAAQNLQPSELRNALKAKLPEYMMPSRIQQLEQFPLNSSGKISIRKLPTPNIMPQQVEAPQNETERLWCEAFGEVLGSDNVGRTTDFFDAGGTSLMAVELIAAARRRHLEATYSDVFAKTTPEQLASSHSEEPKREKAPRKGAQKPRADIHSAPETTTSYLITGAAGFLGAHLLREIWERTDGRIACFVHDKDETPRETLLRSLTYYFGNEMAAQIVGDKRISIGGGDIAEAADWEQFAALSHPIVIHAAADVRQFARGGEILRTNRDGTLKAIVFCLRTEGMLYFVSTISVAGLSFKLERKKKILGENDVNIGQIMLTDYVLSKTLSETDICNAVENCRLQAHILRIGNLAPRSSDGRFQPAANRSGFLQLLAALRAEIKKGEAMSEAARALAEMKVDISPVDIVAKKIADLVLSAPETREGRIATHIFSRNTLTMKEILQQGGSIASLIPEQPALSAEVLALMTQEMRPNDVSQGAWCF